MDGERRWWRPIRRGDRRDGWRPDTRVWLTFCPTHGVMADVHVRWDVCPVCHRPMVVDDRLEYPEEGPIEEASGGH